MRRLCLLLVGALGCTDDDPVADPYHCVAAGGAGCFELPTAIVEAADADGNPVAIALECPAFEVTTASATVAGRTYDATDVQVTLGGVRLEAFSDVPLTTPVFDVTSDDGGTWSATVNTMPSLVHLRSSAAGQLPLYVLHERLNFGASGMLEVPTAMREQIADMVEIAGDQFLPDKAQLVVRAHDCNGNRVVNAIVNIAPVTARNGTRRFEPFVRVYYGADGPLPVPARRTEQMQTSAAGAAVLTNVVPGTHFVQLWGFLDDHDVLVGGGSLKLLAENEIVIYEESGVLTRLHARL